MGRPARRCQPRSTLRHGFTRARSGGHPGPGDGVASPHHPERPRDLARRRRSNPRTPTGAGRGCFRQIRWRRGMTDTDDRLRYRLLTGPDDRSFCERVSAALAEGYELHGGPAATFDGERVIVAQAVVLPDTADAGEGRTAFVEWVDAFGRPNPAFLDGLAAAGVTADDPRPVVFLCRSGVRSVAAAVTATAAGLGPAYNVLTGFEGDVGPDGRRGHQGWRAAGLPWREA